MEKYFTLFKLGINYLYRYRRRYYFLLAALIFGFTVVTFITSTKDAMYENVYYSAQSHYAGDIVALGHEYQNTGGFIYHLGQNEISAILKAADQAGIMPQYTVFRTLFTSNVFLHFNGEAIQLKDLVGCDWERESHIFSKVTFEYPPQEVLDDEGIIISLPVAQQLGAELGDSIILELNTRYGQRNTSVFIVRGIVQDTSIFGYYKAYISRLAHNRMVLFDDDDCSSIGFFLHNPDTAEQQRQRLQNYLSTYTQTGPLVYDRDGFFNERNREWEGNLVFLYTMPVYLSEIAYLLNAMNLITYFIYGMMLITILVSANVTYRLILQERSKEMGVMRSIGFYGNDLRLILLTEIIVLGIIAIITGFLLARLPSWLVSLMSFSWFPGFNIFMNNGKLTSMYLASTMLINIVLLILILVILSLHQSFRIVHKKLPELLSGEPL